MTVPDPKEIVKLSVPDPESRDWVTLEDWVIRMVIEGKAKSPEFLAALEFFGRSRFTKIWKDYCANKKK